MAVVAHRPRGRGGDQRVAPPEAGQSAPVVGDHRALERVAERGIGAREKIHGPGPTPWSPLASTRTMAGANTSSQPTPQRLAAIRAQMSLLADYL